MAALLENLIFVLTHDCVLGCGMAVFSKQQFRHISPAGLYQITNFFHSQTLVEKVARKSLAK